MIWLLATLAFATDPPPAEPPPEPAPEELPILEPPAVTKYVEAEYPAEAQAAGKEAIVHLQIELDDTGKLVNVEILEPVGDGFDESALEAVWQMEFSPAKTAEGPIPVIFEFDYGFTLQVAEPPPVDPAIPAGPPPVAVDGQIREMGTRGLVEGAKVVVVGVPEAEATTDENGRFEIRGVPPGDYTLRILSTEHVTLDQPITVADGKITSATLWIRAEQYRENEAVGVYSEEKSEVTQRTITMDEIRRIPGTFGDPVKVVQTLPGAARSPFGTGFLIIRGSNPEDSGVYVDGVRVPLIYHLTGTTSVLSPDLIEAVDYLPGGYGVQYGRSMGGVVDVRTKSKIEKDKIVWGTDILDSQLYFEGNVGKKDKQWGIAAGARRSYIDAFLPLFVRTGFSLKPRYWDYQLKVLPPQQDDERLSVFIYGFDDILTVSTPDDFAQGSDQDTQGDLSTHYSSHRVMVTVDEPLTEQLRLRVIPSLGVDYGSFGLGDGFALSSWNTVIELRTELPWTPSKHAQFVPGIDVIGGWWKFVFASPFRITDLDDPLGERESVSFDGRGTAWGPDVYLKANLRPLKDPDALLITPGVRANIVTNTYKGTVTGTDGGNSSFTIASYDPRIAVIGKAFDGGTFKASTGLYNQPPQPSESVGVGTDAQVGFERSWSSSVGFEHQVTPAIQWDLELFYKAMDRLIIYDDSWTGYGDVVFVNEGVGRSYGAELILRHAKTGPFFGWLSYTLSHAERRDGPVSEGHDWYDFEFDQTHIFSAQGGYDLPMDFSISAQTQYVTGNPDTPYNAGVYDGDGDFYNPFRIGSYDSERLPSYFQVSVRADKLWTFKTWQLDTYIDVMNAVRGVNPEFTIYNYDYTEHAYVRGLPVIPNIGVEGRFWP